MFTYDPIPIKTSVIKLTISIILINLLKNCKTRKEKDRIRDKLEEIQEKYNKLFEKILNIHPDFKCPDEINETEKQTT
ncbi:MAG: hypothetical protein GH151_13200 [Bacteroidetes bacterium]|nr:hypothetical protein [Bacteroidota bacterium]